MNINELFETKTNETTVAGRGLAGTARLTTLANNIATNIIKAMEENIEEYNDRIKLSTSDSKELDKIIDELGEINPDDAQFITEFDEATIEGMLKSQQSKRSRSKSKTMTLDNYRTYMTAAVAENIIRIVTGKPKTYTGMRTSLGTIDYTIEQLEALGADQDALRKEIRNVQSKKSIMKSKSDFDESSERYQALLKAEQQLKDLRVGTSVQYVDTTKDKLTEMLAETDVTKLKADDARELLEAINSILAE